MTIEKCGRTNAGLAQAEPDDLSAVDYEKMFSRVKVTLNAKNKVDEVWLASALEDLDRSQLTMLAQGASAHAV